MDYLEIVLRGYFNDNNSEFLSKYFFRECKKAEKEYFEADEFFNGCLKVLKRWEQYLQDKIHERKRELYLMLSGAKNGTLKYGDLEGESIDKKRQETIEYCEKELNDVRPDGVGCLSFTVHLHSLTNGRVAYSMYYNELLQIKMAILKAWQKVQPEQENIQADFNGDNQVKPTFERSAVKEFLQIIKPYFDANSHQQLEFLLLNLNDLAEPLVFKGNGNQLTDSFKKIIENGLITGWKKKDLIKWIVRNFQFIDKQNKPSTYKERTVEQTISADKHSSPCKKPIIEIEKGLIQKKDY